MVLSSIRFKHDIPVYYDPNRKSRPDRQRWLDIEIASNELLPGLIGGVTCSSPQRLDVRRQVTLTSCFWCQRVPTSCTRHPVSAKSTSVVGVTSKAELKGPPISKPTTSAPAAFALRRRGMSRSRHLPQLARRVAPARSVTDWACARSPAPFLKRVATYRS